MKQRIELNLKTREAGRANSRELRNNKMVPAVIYGAVKPINAAIHVNDVIKYNSMAYENALLNLKSEDTAINGKVALLKEVTVHPLTRVPQHVDLFALDMNKSIRVFVEVKVEGKAIGLSEGGLLNIVARQVEVECLPTEIPEALSIDISDLGVGESVHADKLTMPKGAKLISAPELTIATIVEQREEEAAPVAAAAAPAAAAAAAPAKDAKAPAAKK